MHEIISLQLGNCSNFLGSHYWNLLNEEQITTTKRETKTLLTQSDSLNNEFQKKNSTLNSSQFYRLKSSSRNHEPIPRMISFGAKGSIGSFRKLGANTKPSINTNKPKEEIYWNENIQTYNQESLPPNRYQNSLHSDEKETSQDSFPIHNIELWTEYFQNTMHSKSIMEIPEIHSFDPFHNFSEGLWDNNRLHSNTIETSMDQIRYFLEECDSLQGFQCFVDIDSGWGGFTTSLLHHLQEECPSASIICLGLDQEYPIIKESDLISSSKFKKRSRRNLNLGLSTSKLSELCSIYVPISCQKALEHNFFSESQQLFQSSGYIALAYRLATSAFHSKESSIGMRQFMNSLLFENPYSSIVQMACEMSCKTISNYPENLIHWMSKHTLLPISDDKKNISMDSIHLYNQWVSSIGLNGKLNQPKSIVEYCRQTSFQHSYFSNITSKLTVPFYYNQHKSQPESINAFTQLSSSTHLNHYLLDVSNQYTKICSSRSLIQEYQQGGIETDEIVQVECHLKKLSEIETLS